MAEIIVYTQDECPPCKIVKMYLNDQKISFNEKNITNDADARNELIHTYQSSSTPTVIIGNEVITGFDLERLEKVLKQK
ncbi:glutaredoxin family protein [Bacillus sp. B15-48]|uniref:glutaredoxin family protein n=1 Tax=Bacillus sp. B15-48 TaxID=1548601 RepID=UPI0019400CCB|nr:glutaredoxin family protein [Bacillus sp. B15-48]MBM4764340.1 NrdH-redoxin [Bacillus sp. B15-48]